MAEKQITEREIKALQIAATSKLTRKGNVWIVPSQAGHGEYKVNADPDAPRCTCPDFEFRNARCKHVLAVEYTLMRETTSDGQTVVTETVKVTRKTYSQNWGAYNAAQTKEKSEVQALLYELCKGLPEPMQRTGRPRLSLSDIIFSSVFKIYSTVSGRRFSTDLRVLRKTGQRILRQWPAKLKLIQLKVDWPLVFDLFLYILLAILSLITTYLGGHMALSPPETARAKNLYRLSFVVICIVSLATIITIGVRQYRAAARADATQKELQGSIDDIRKQLQSAEVSRRLTGEGFLETKKMEVFAGTFAAGNVFRVNVETRNPGAGKITDPLTVSWIKMIEDEGGDMDRKIRDRFEELIRPYRTDYLRRKPQAPEVQGSHDWTWATLEYQLREGDVEALVKGSKRLYVFILYGWTDSQGRKLFSSDCRFLQASTVPAQYQDKDIIWHVCAEEVSASSPN